MKSISGFEWNEDKAEINIQKHKVSFFEATTVFDNQNSLSIADIKHSIIEPRFFMIGKSDNNRIIIVSYTIRKHNIRIISSRLANKKESKLYEIENKNI